MEKKFISFVAYLHNNEDGIKEFMETLCNMASSKFENYELILVDDACVDDTLLLVKQYVEDNKLSHMVSIVHMGFFQGMEASMNAGRDSAIGDFVFEFDDVDIDFEGDVIFNVYEKSLEGFDIVTATGSGKKRFSSNIFYSLYNRFAHGSGKIGPEKFRLLSRRAINRVKSMGVYIPYRKAVYANCGLKTTGVSYQSIARSKKKGKFSQRGSLALDSFIYFTNLLEKLSAVISGVFLLITVLVGIYIITDYFNVHKPVEGWVSTMAFLAFGFFGVFALLTIILKYFSVLLNLEFKKQRYLVSDIEKVVGK